MIGSHRVHVAGIEVLCTCGDNATELCNVQNLVGVLLLLTSTHGLQLSDVLYSLTLHDQLQLLIISVLSYSTD